MRPCLKNIVIIKMTMRIVIEVGGAIYWGKIMSKYATEVGIGLLKQGLSM